jgi:hypothetical protein
MADEPIDKSIKDLVDSNERVERSLDALEGTLHSAASDIQAAGIEADILGDIIAEKSTTVEGGKKEKESEDEVKKTKEAIEPALTSITAKLGKVIDNAKDNTKTLSERLTEGFKNSYESLQKNADILGNTKDAFSNDIGKLGIAFAPLQAIPGVETIMTLVKSLLSKLLLTTINAFRFQRKEAAKKKGEERLKALQGDGAEMPDIEGAELPDSKGALRLFFGGLAVAVGVFFKGFLAGFKQGLARTLQFFGIKRWTKALNASALKNLRQMGGKITAFGNKIRKFFAPLGKVSKIFQPVIKVITGILSKIGAFGKILGKIFWPINVIIGAIFGLKGAVKGFQRYTGEGLAAQILGGITGFLGGVTSYLIGWPLDLLKSAVTWIGDKLGFDMSALEEFSFQDMFKDLYNFLGDSIIDSFNYIKDLWKNLDVSEYFGNLMSIAMNKLKTMFLEVTALPKALMAGGKAALFSLLGDPVGAFNEAFNESMAGSETAIEAEKLKGAELTAQQEATTEAARDVQYGGKDRDAQTVNNVVQTNNQSVSNTKKSAPSKQRVSDEFSHRLALAQ